MQKYVAASRKSISQLWRPPNVAFCQMVMTWVSNDFYCLYFGTLHVVYNTATQAYITVSHGDLSRSPIVFPDAIANRPQLSISMSMVQRAGWFEKLPAWTKSCLIKFFLLSYNYFSSVAVWFHKESHSALEIIKSACCNHDRQLWSWVGKLTAWSAHGPNSFSVQVITQNPSWVHEQARQVILQPSLKVAETEPLSRL